MQKTTESHSVVFLAIGADSILAIFEKSIFAVGSILVFRVEFREAGTADALVAVGEQVILRAAENAGGLVFAQDDVILLRRDFEQIVFLNIHCAPQLDGQNDPPEFINLTNDSCLHMSRSLSLFV